MSTSDARTIPTNGDVVKQQQQEERIISPIPGASPIGSCPRDLLVATLTKSDRPPSPASPAPAAAASPQTSSSPLAMSPSRSPAAGGPIPPVSGGSSIFSTRSVVRANRKTPAFSILVPEREAVARHVQPTGGVSAASPHATPVPSDRQQCPLSAAAAAAANNNNSITNPNNHSGSSGSAHHHLHQQHQQLQQRGGGLVSSTTPMHSPQPTAGASSSFAAGGPPPTPSGYHERTFGASPFSATRLLPLLYLGNEADAGMPDELRHRNIRRILNVAFDCRKQEFAAYGIEVLHVPLRDCGDEDIYSHFGPLCAWIHEGITRGEGVIVHCRLGVSRSATIAIAYLMTYGIHQPTRILHSQHRFRVNPLSEQSPQGQCRCCEKYGRTWLHYEDNAERINRAEFHVHPEASAAAAAAAAIRYERYSKSQPPSLPATPSSPSQQLRSWHPAQPNARVPPTIAKDYCFTDYGDVFAYVSMRREQISPNLGFSMQIRKLNVSHGFSDFFAEMSPGHSDEYACGGAVDFADGDDPSSCTHASTVCGAAEASADAASCGVAVSVGGGGEGGAAMGGGGRGGGGGSGGYFGAARTTTTRGGSSEQQSCFSDVRVDTSIFVSPTASPVGCTPFGAAIPCSIGIGSIGGVTPATTIATPAAHHHGTLTLAAVGGECALLRGAQLRPAAEGEGSDADADRDAADREEAELSTSRSQRLPRVRSSPAIA